MATIDNTYKNPLDNFSTYSYHYILTAGSTTESLRKILEGTSDGATGLLSAIQTKKLGDSFKAGNETAYLLLDTRRFSQYFITSVEMTNIYGTGSKINPSVPTSALKMALTDSTGLSFFNFLMDMFRNKMQTSISSSFFLLSILFIGHRDDGTTETISTCNMVLLLASIGFNLTNKGSEFDISFYEMEGAPQNAPTYSQLVSLGNVKCASTAKNAGSNTIGEMVDDLENKLNTQSLEYFQKYFNEANKQGNSKPGKLVQYMITIPNDKTNNWRQLKITGAAKSANTESKFLTQQQVVQDATKPALIYAKAASKKINYRYSEITFSDVTTIPDAIKIILESSDDFVKLGGTAMRLSGKAKSFKVVTSVTSDEFTYVVHFDVYPHHLPKLQDTSQLTAGSTKKIVGDAGSTQIMNKIEYDYIFTGHNSDILDLRIDYQPDVARMAIDTDVSVGFFRHAVVAAAGQKLSDVKKQSSGSEKTTGFSPMIRPGDPIFIPVKTKDEKNNNTSQKNEALTEEQARESFTAKQEYTQTYAMLHFLGSMSLDMTIRGNPNLMRKFADRAARQSVAPHQAIVKDSELTNLAIQMQGTAPNNFQSSVKNGVASAKQYYISTYVQPRINTIERTTGPDALLNGPDVAIMPLFVKINIKSPDVDWTGAFNDSNNLFTNKFFFNGYYQLLTITSTLNNGDFIQKMSLMPYDIDASYTTSNDKK